VGTFDEVTAVQRRGPGRFEAEVHPEWSIGPKAHGGYLLALVGRAVVDVGPHPDPVAMSAHFVRSPSPGPVEIDVELLRAGRSASQLRAELRQADEVCVVALCTASTLADEPVHWDRGAPRRSGPSLEQCVPARGTGPGGTTVALMDQLDLRFDPACLGFADGAPSGRGVVQGWLGLRDGRPFDPLSLLVAVDALPPASFDIERTGWVPTLELTCYLRGRPAEGPVWVEQAARLIAGERLDEICTVWDVDGRIVAQATQLAGVRLAR
jgi:acyl-coenzyme A thioesterase PaaI-like protein